MGPDRLREVDEHLVVRSYQPGDQEAVSDLYTTGLLAGQIAANDTGADIEQIQDAYFSDPANHFWVAELHGQIMGMIGVARDEGPTAEIRRLRVRRDWQNVGIGGRLIAVALQHCQHHGYIKVVLDTRFNERGSAVELFDRFGFQHTRTKSLHGKDLLEFYLDLYRQPKREPQKR